MNQIMTGAAVVLIFIFMLLSPQEVFDGAADGLLLWFQIIIPTLFPFMLISNLLIESGGIRLIARVTGRFFYAHIRHIALWFIRCPYRLSVRLSDGREISGRSGEKRENLTGRRTIPAFLLQ